MSKAVSQFIDLVRWIATMFVAVHHVNNVFINQADIMKAPHDAPVYVWWFLTAYTFAHGAVVVFFVISGFLVGGAIIERSQGTRPYLRNYLIDRSIRIYIVLLPALAYSYFADSFGARLFAGLGVYEHPVYQAAMRLEYLAATVVSLQGVWSPTFGTNGALWTLGMEFWFYVICGLVLLPRSTAYTTSARWTGFALGLAIFAVLAISPSFFLFGAGVWAIGAAARIAPRPLMRSKWLALATWLVVMTIIRLVTHGEVILRQPLAGAIDAVNALLFANVLLALRFDNGEGFAWARSPIHTWLSNFTYSLYVTHWPTLMWLQALAVMYFGVGWTQQLATPTHYAVAIASVLFLVLFAYLFSRATEAKTDVARRWLRSALPGESKPQSA